MHDARGRSEWRGLATVRRMPIATPSSPPLAGIDFTSRPTRRKPIVVALGREAGGAVRLDRIETHAGNESFAQWLASPGPWLGVFDLPFGLPRELVLALGWPTEWRPLMAHYAGLSRESIRDTFAAFCSARAAGSKFAHRATDRPAGSSPSMKWVNPPVAYMLHAGVPLLVEAGLHLPGLHEGDRQRVALEGYPGLLAREVLGARSYKSDDKAKQTAERLIARTRLIDALGEGRTRLALRLALSPSQREELTADASGDRLDAVLCLVQAAWASRQPAHGLPESIDPLEGWIVTAPDAPRGQAA
jgi:Protein of unknown function (DUF429)